MKKIISRFLCLLLFPACLSVALAASNPPKNIPSIPTMAALQAITSAAAIKYADVYLSGFYDGNTAGGGEFKWLTAAQASALGVSPDGGVVIPPSNHTADCSSGCWRREFNQFVYPEFWGALPAYSAQSPCIATDYTTQMQKWANYVVGLGEFGPSKAVGGLNGGKYCVSSTLYLGAGIYQGSGTTFSYDGSGPYPPGNGNSVIGASIANILVARGGQAIRDVIFDGAIVGGSGNALGCWVSSDDPTHFQENVLVQNVYAAHCTYGIVTDQLQNSAFVDVSAQRNKYNLVIANGSQIDSFYHYECATVSDSYITLDADSRCILSLVDTTNVSGLNLSTSVTTNGNWGINFFGGITEDQGAGSDYSWDSKNLSATGVLTGDEWTFHGMHIQTDNHDFNFNATWAGTIDCYSCVLYTGAEVSTGTNGSLLLHGNTEFAYHAAPSSGITNNTNFQTLLNQSWLSQGAPPYSANSGSVVTYDIPTHAFSVACSGGAAATDGFIYPADAFSLDTTRENFVQAYKPIVTITFTVVSATGGSTQVSLYSFEGGSSYTLIGSYGVGPHTVTYQTTGASTGEVGFGCHDLTAFSVAGGSVTY